MKNEEFVKKFFDNNKTLVQYVRHNKNKKGERIGVVVAAKVDGEIRLGFSLCNVKLEPFNRYLGLYKAIHCLDSSKEVPHTVKPVYEEMAARASRYFKDANLKSVPMRV